MCLRWHHIRQYSQITIIHCADLPYAVKWSNLNQFEKFIKLSRNFSIHRYENMNDGKQTKFTSKQNVEG